MPRRPRRPTLRVLAVSVLLALGQLVPGGHVAAQGMLAPLTADQLSHRLAREVFGYLPYWELDSGTDAYLRYDLLSTIAFFGIGIRSDGSLDTTTSGYRAYLSDLASSIIEKAHAAGVRTIITFQSFGTTRNAAFFSNPAAQATFVQQAVALMSLRGADGANLDIEGLESTYFPAFGALTGALRQAALAVNPNAEISVATNANTSGARMAAVAIANGADRAFLMGYNYRGVSSSPVGSIDPLVRADGGLSLSKSLDLYASYGVPLERVLLGLPYYGRTWPTGSADLRAARQTDTATYGGSTIFYPSTLPASAAGATFDYDSLEQAARLVRYDPVKATWVQSYYNDPLTLAAKIALTNTRNLAGTGIWALGYDRGQPGYWDAIANAYGAPTVTSVTIAAAPADLGQVPPPDTTPSPSPTPSPTLAPGQTPPPDTTPSPSPDPTASPAPPIVPSITPLPGVTNSTSVTIATTWLDGAAPTSDIRLSNDGITWSGWQPLSPLVPWSLVAGGPDGVRTVSVQLRGASGALSRVATGSVVLDSTPPVTTTPAAIPPLRAVTAPTSLPVRVAWSATDATAGVAAFGLEVSTDGGSYAPVPLASRTAASAVLRLAFGHAYRFRVTPVDLAGNVGAPVEGPTTTIAPVQDASRAIGYSAGWRRVTSPAASGGTTTYATAKGASATFRFTDLRIAILGALGPTRGAARVFIDGAAAGSLGEYAATGASRRVVYARTFPVAGSHTIRIQVAGTSGHPQIDLDAFLVLR